MSVYSFVQCDVFTDRVFAGNPLAVFPDSAGIDEVTMQQIAREMNLSETVFVLPPGDPAKALRRLRIFTPGTELPMAGHPVVGTWLMLARMGVVAPPASGNGAVTIQQELKLGILPVTIEFADGQPVKVVMTQGTPNVGVPLDEIAACAEVLRLSPNDIGDAGNPALPIVVASTGVDYLIVPVRTREALRRIRPNTAAMPDLFNRVGAHAVYPVTKDVKGSDAFVSARMFADESLGVSEDPATGSAAGPLAATLVHYGIAQAVNGIARFVIEQGVDMGRPSRIEAAVEGTAGAVTVVRIGGSAVPVLEGNINLVQGKRGDERA